MVTLGNERNKIELWKEGEVFQWKHTLKGIIIEHKTEFLHVNDAWDSIFDYIQDYAKMGLRWAMRLLDMKKPKEKK